MQTLTEVIEMIGEKPHLYLTSRTLDCLRSFIDGWRLGRDYPEEDEMLIAGFQRWIAERFGHAQTTQSWNRIIEYYSKDGYAALEQFFVLFAEFQRLHV